MFTTFDMLSLIGAGVIGICVLAFYLFAWKRWRSEDYRCPGCNFLVNAKDVEHYGHICPDCRTDWRVHPLKNDNDEEVEDEIPDEDRKSDTNRSEHSRKKLVR